MASGDTGEGSAKNQKDPGKKKPGYNDRLHGGNATDNQGSGHGDKKKNKKGK